MATVNSTSSTTSSSTYSSRVTGMFSGLDTDALVKSMVSTQQTRIDAVKQKQTYQEWTNEALSSVESDVTEFLNEYCSGTGSSSMLKAASYYKYNITSDSDSNAVSLSTSGSALSGDYSVAVTQLAIQSNVSSSVTDGDGISGSGGEISSSNTAKLGDLSFENSLFNGGDEISFSINGKTFSFTKDTTLQSMINTINSDEDANVTMKYSRLTDAFTITADSGGADSKVAIRNITGNAFGTNSAFQISEGTYKNGQNSISVINGKTITKDSNEFTIDGVTFKLSAVTNKTDTGTITSDELINFTVERDYSATTDSITKFVDAFNSLLTKLTDLVNAKDYSDDYPPLTDAQKEEMTEEQIKTWESKAKSGVLRNNSDLEGLITNLKNAFYSTLGGTGKNTSSIGITTASYFSENAGLFVVDTDALTTALKNNPEEVVSMFTNGSSTSATSDMGLLYKMRNVMSKYNDTLDESQEASDDKIDAYDDDIDELEDKLDKMADRYYEKFSRMETALAALNSQASYISQLFTTA